MCRARFLMYPNAISKAIEKPAAASRCARNSGAGKSSSEPSAARVKAAAAYRYIKGTFLSQPKSIQ